VGAHPLALGGELGLKIDDTVLEPDLKVDVRDGVRATRIKYLSAVL
jgi:hypothetical protein